MKYQLKTLIPSIILLIFGNLIIVNAEPLDLPPKEETVKKRINWGDVKGAVKYEVQISDLTGKILVKDTVEKSQFDFVLPYGTYRVRIGAVNKFGDMGSWSDWANISLKKPAKEPPKKETVYTDMSLKIGIGGSYFQLLSKNWNSLYDNSFNSAIIHLSICPLNFFIFRYTGLELEGSFVEFKSKEDQWRIETSMNDIFVGGNLLIMTKFSYPINLFLRCGGGVAYTEQEYEKIDENNDNFGGPIKDKLVSKDLYYKAGFSVEYRFMPNLYLESGADYYYIDFLTSDLKTVRYFLIIGTGI